MNSEVSNRMMAINSPNENAMISSKNTLVEPTPRKMPFKDSTNHAAELLKSAAKRAEKLDVIQVQEYSLKEQNQIQQEKEAIEELDFTEFKFPKERDCFCCGADRNPQGMTLSEDFLVNLMTNMEKSVPLEAEPMTPSKIPEPIAIDTDFRFSPEPMMSYLPPPFTFDDFGCIDEDLNSTKYSSSVDSPDVNGTNHEDSDMKVPDFDFSFDIGQSTSNSIDNSIIQDW